MTKEKEDGCPSSQSIIIFCFAFIFNNFMLNAITCVKRINTTAQVSHIACRIKRVYSNFRIKIFIKLLCHIQHLLHKVYARTNYV